MILCESMKWFNVAQRREILYTDLTHQIKTCRVPLQGGAEQGHLDDAGVREDGDAGQKVDWAPGFRVRRSAGRTYGMAFQHALVSYHCSVCTVWKKKHHAQNIISGRNGSTPFALLFTTPIRQY